LVRRPIELKVVAEVGAGQSDRARSGEPAAEHALADGEPVGPKRVSLGIGEGGAIEAKLAADVSTDQVDLALDGNLMTDHVLTHNESMGGECLPAGTHQGCAPETKRSADVRTNKRDLSGGGKPVAQFEVAAGLELCAVQTWSAAAGQAQSRGLRLAEVDRLVEVAAVQTERADQRDGGSSQSRV
jgi:hypothetical protein